MSRLLFVTGTRADWAKMRSLFEEAEARGHRPALAATGLHLSPAHGYTIRDLFAVGRDVFAVTNGPGNHLGKVLALTAIGLDDLLREMPEVSHVVVHGDRAEALAAAFTAAAAELKVIHLEGGEVSGHIDNRTRDAITALADYHLTCTPKAAYRVAQMGHDNVQCLGSGDVDVLLNPARPTIEQVAARYETPTEGYILVVLHPETGVDNRQLSLAVANGLRSYRGEIVRIASNRDPHWDDLAITGRERVLPSMRPEHFATLLEHASVLVGNSSAGQHQAPYYGTPVVEVGTRQLGRDQNPYARICRPHPAAVSQSVMEALEEGRHEPLRHRGEPGVGRRFVDWWEGLERP